MSGLNGLVNNAGILRDGLLVKKDRTTGAVPSGFMVTEEVSRSSKVYISFWTMSVTSPTPRAKSEVGSRMGVLIRR